QIEEKSVRRPTLGCYPPTGAIASEAKTLTGISEAMLVATSRERQGRAIDHAQSGSMDLKKRPGDF
ncbi:sulfate adenylyltransferase small subunit, partial [Vibrio parahaemolyticus]|nr:sulfate adenylyltransferase small subunit [Vibrio parahaemolyticus]